MLVILTVVLYRRVKENELKKKEAKEKGGLKVDCKRKVWFFFSTVGLTPNFFSDLPSAHHTILRHVTSSVKNVDCWDLSFFLILPVSLLITVSNKKKLIAFESRLCCSKAWWPLVANVCSHMTGKFYFFIQIICWAPRLHRFSFPSVFFIAQPCELLYSSHDHSECPVGSVTFCLQLKWLWMLLEELFVAANQLEKMQGHWMIFWSEVEIYKWLPDIYKRLGFLVFSDKGDKLYAPSLYPCA